MSKTKKLSELERICKESRERGKRIGLITGCFDIFHLGHIKLFHFAKKHVNILIVGVDNDESVKLSKGANRPIFSQDERTKMLSDLETVDYIFITEKVIRFDSDEADSAYEEIIGKLKPSTLITTPLADKYWRKKKQRAKKLKVRFLPYPREKHISSSKIIKILEKEL